MRFDIVESVTLHKLADTESRRGRLATFLIKEHVTNGPFLIKEIGNIVLTFTSLLSGLNTAPHNLEKNLFSFDGDSSVEINNCWMRIGIENNRWVLVLTHKYWAQEQVDMFRSIVRLVAARQNWKIVDENLEPASAGCQTASATEQR